MAHSNFVLVCMGGNLGAVYGGDRDSELELSPVNIRSTSEAFSR